MDSMATGENSINSGSSLTPHLLRKGVDAQCGMCSTRSHCDAACLLEKISSDRRHQLVRIRKFNKGQHVFCAGEALDNLFLVKSGTFKTYLTSEAGDEKITGFQLPGDLLGADAAVRHVHNLSAVALESSTVCSIPIKQLEYLAKGSMPEWLITQLYKEMLRERNLLVVTGRKYSADARIAYFLLDMSARNKSHGYSAKEFKITMPQRDIAHYLDMAFETVSRVFTRFQDTGLVTIKRPYAIITDFEKLRELADIRTLPERLSA